MHIFTDPALLFFVFGVFAGLPDRYEATRYHSLVVARDTLPDRIEDDTAPLLGTPDEVIARLNREVAAALTHPDVKKRLLDLHIEAKASTPEQLGTLLSSEVKRWGDVITRANIPRQ